MAFDNKNIGPLQAYEKLNQLKPTTQANNNDKAASFQGIDKAQQQVSTQVSKMELKTEQQASMVAHLFGDGEKTQQSALKITYQAAIEKINEILMAEMPTPTGEEPTTKPISEEALKAQGGMEYWTPENTAKRIVGGATAFFAGFQKAHPELEGEALMNRFMEVGGGGLNQGFEEARNILDDLGVLKDDIANNIDQTFDLVQSGMQDYQNQFLANLTETTEPEQTASEEKQV